MEYLFFWSPASTARIKEKASDGSYAGYLWNPNGSEKNVAGICNPQGNVFGMMPHPERVMDREMHPDWTRAFPTGLGDGMAIFESVLDEISKKF